MRNRDLVCRIVNPKLKNFKEFGRIVMVALLKLQKQMETEAFNLQKEFKNTIKVLYTTFTLYIKTSEVTQ